MCPVYYLDSYGNLRVVNPTPIAPPTQVVYFPETDSGAYCEQPLHACFPAVCLSAIPNDEAMN